MTSHDVVYPTIVIDKPTARIALWTGRILSGVAALALFADSFGKLVEVRPVIDGTLALGYPRESVFMLGVILFTCVLIYVSPRTSVLGAILLTAYLGGAVATHVRVGSPLFTHILVPTYVAAFVWGGLLLRDPRLCAFLPWATRAGSRTQANGHR
jgi:hypothetical protein